MVVAYLATVSYATANSFLRVILSCERTCKSYWALFFQAVSASTAALDYSSSKDNLAVVALSSASSLVLLTKSGVNYLFLSSRA